jgi:predicted MFS family arabinose efflux permease
MPTSPHRNVILLGLAQLLAWGSTYYLPAMLALPMARDLGLSNGMVFAAFSWALIVSALLGPAAGWASDKFGGRAVLMSASVLLTAALALLSQAQGALQLFAAWSLIGAGMAAGLYEGAFAAAVQFYGRDARGPITGITLLGGLASTVAWPVSAWLEINMGWREACLAWAAVHLLINLPLYGLLRKPQAPQTAPESVARESASATHGPERIAEMKPELSAAQQRRAALLLALIFALTWFISTAMAAHLPRLLQVQGIDLATALLLGSLIGPAQVAARLLEYTVLRHQHPLLSARLAGAMHPLGAALFMLAGAPAGALFALLHGVGNGVLTIAKGVLPLVLFGPQGYALRQGLLMVPARFAQALAPLAFALALDHWGGQALWLSTALGLICLGALLALPEPRPKR